ncbi:MAG: histidinol-phosphate transaminase [Bacteroidota bacterium]
MITNDFDLDKLIRENVKQLTPYSSARDEYKEIGATMVFLDANENPYDNGVNRYPDPHQRDLKTVMAANRGVTPNQLLLGNGSDEVLDLLFRAFCEPHVDQVITLPPTYGMYKVLAATNAIQNIEVLLDTKFQPQVNQILEKASPTTKLLFLCSPNNPTGNSVDMDKVEALLRGFQGLVVIDEAYIDFADSNSWVDRLAEFPNLVVTQTLSKAYGLAGIRLGSCYASEAIITTLKKIKPPYNVNQLTQDQALSRILQPDLLEKEVSNILKQRDRLLLKLEAIDFVETIYPTSANFVLVKVDNANKRYQELIEQGVVVRNRSTQPLCAETLRFTVGTPEENSKLITALQTIAS